MSSLAKSHMLLTFSFKSISLEALSDKLVTSDCINKENNYVLSIGNGHRTTIPLNPEFQFLSRTRTRGVWISSGPKQRVIKW